MTRRLTITIVVSLAITVAWIFLLFIPENSKQAKLRAEVESAQAQFREYQTTIAQLPVYIESRAELQKKLQLANSNLYAKEDLVLLFDELERSAKDNGLRLVDITPPVNELLELNRALPSEGEPQILTLTVVLKGNFIDFGRYVETLERAPYFRSVQSCVVARDIDSGEQVTYSLGFKALLGMTVEEVS